MTRRPVRAFSLLEVLAATVLLAIVASVCLPLFSAATATVLVDPRGAVSATELRHVAEQIQAEPDRFGIAALDPIESADVAWPDHPERPSIRVRRLTSDDADHSWLSVGCGDLTVHCWQPAAAPPESDAP